MENQTDPLPILLVIPIVMPLIGIFYLNQRLSNSAIGLYVRDNLRARVRSILKQDVLEWEEYVRINTSVLKELTLFFFILLVFAGPSFTMLALTHTMRSPVVLKGEPLAWWSGGVLSLVWTVLWITQFPKWFGSQKLTSENR